MSRAVTLPVPGDAISLLDVTAVPNGQVFDWRGLRVIRSTDGGSLHLSISHCDRYPTWDELRDARYAFLPNHLYFGMVLPPKEEYVNVHPNVFHLWQL